MIIEDGNEGVRNINKNSGNNLYLLNCGFILYSSILTLEVPRGVIERFKPIQKYQRYSHQGETFDPFSLENEFTEKKQWH